MRWRGQPRSRSLPLTVDKPQPLTVDKPQPLTAVRSSRTSPVDAYQYA
jgi:hypothetical protein